MWWYTGAHSVLRVMPEGGKSEADERLIPFVAAYIDARLADAHALVRAPPGLDGRLERRALRVAVRVVGVQEHPAAELRQRREAERLDDMVFAARDHEIAPMLPGYGDSEECGEIRDMLDFTLHTHDVMTGLGLVRPIVVGHSMGGMIACEMAANDQSRVGRLVAIAPAGLFDMNYPMPDIFAMRSAELAELAVERDCARLEWSVLDWNEPAIGFYRKLGARLMDEWTVMRVDGENLSQLGAAARNSAD